VKFGVNVVVLMQAVNGWCILVWGLVESMVELQCDGSVSGGSGVWSWMWIWVDSRGMEQVSIDS